MRSTNSLFVPNRTPNPDRANGFTLVEILVSIALMGLVIGYFVHARIEHMKVQLGENIAQEVLSLSNLALSYYVAEATAGRWPDSASTPACGGALGALESEGYLPADYVPVASATVSTRCADGDTGSFDITLQFDGVDSDLVQVVRTMLPGATTSNSGSDIQLMHRVFPPRRAGKQYYFSKAEYIGSGQFSVEKPPCGSVDEHYIAIPQRICVEHERGLQGYYFANSETESHWTITLCVGTLNGGGGGGGACGGGGPPGTVTYARHGPECDGAVPEVAVVTYCE